MLCYNSRMSFVFCILRNWLESQKGATAVEYGLIAAGIALVIAVSVFAFGGEVEALYASLDGALDGP